MTLRSIVTFRAVTLDAAGTLFTVSRPVDQTYAQFALAQGVRLSPDRLAEGFRREFSRMPPLAFPAAPSGRIRDLERGWWRELVQRVVAESGQIEDFDRYFDALYDHYAHANAWHVYPEVQGVLARLKDLDLRLAVVSNFDSRLERILHELALDHHFD